MVLATVAAGKEVLSSYDENSSCVEAWLTRRLFTVPYKSIYNPKMMGYNETRLVYRLVNSKNHLLSSQLLALLQSKKVFSSVT